MKHKRYNYKGLLLVLWFVAMICLCSIPNMQIAARNNVGDYEQNSNTCNGTPEGSYINAPGSTTVREVPFEPKDYNFYDNQKTGNYEKSHYSTHDWIADAALRLLIKESGSLENSDWKWLMQSMTDPSPEWEETYSDSNQDHNTIRSYISFLFATQMPDMKKTDDQKIPQIQPEYINLWDNEGEFIADHRHNLGYWIGNTAQQHYRWEVKDVNDNGDYLLGPVISTSQPTRSHVYAKKMADQALRCLTHKEGDEIWAKVEAGASYLGSMTHYIADITCPPHLMPRNGIAILDSDNFDSAINVENYGSGFHNWFEYQTNLYTYWDRRTSYIGPYGLEDNIYAFFGINPVIIGENGNNIPKKEPQQAVMEAAKSSIDTSFGFVEGKQYAQTGNNKKGVYIDSLRNYLYDDSHPQYWKWTDPTKDRDSTNKIVGTADNSLTFIEYYDLVEKLLNYAVWYTACAMKWVMNEVKDKNKEDFDPNKWAETPYIELHPDELPSTPVDPKSKKNSLKPNPYDTRELDIENDYKIGMMMAIMSIGSPILTVVFAPKIIKYLKKEN